MDNELNKDTAMPEEETENTACEAPAEETCEQATPEEEKPGKAEKKKLKKLESELAEAQKHLAAAEAQAAEANDKYVRLFAEYDNYRKRTQKEKDGIYTEAYADALVQILPVLDNLERAVQYGENPSENETLAKGLDLTLKSFYETLKKMGVCEIEALGKPFDPNLHNAVMHVEDESLGENEVVEVFMKGYIKGDRVLRHAMVKVAN